MLPTIVASVRDSAPRIELVTRELYASDIEDAVANRALDLGLVRRPDGRPGTLHEPISTEPLALAVSATGPFARRRLLELSEAAGAGLAVWPRELIPGFFDASVDAWTAAGGSRDHVDTTSSGAALWSDIASGRRVGLVVESLERSRPRDIRVVRLRAAIDVGVSVVLPTTGRTRATDRILQIARQSCASTK